MKIYGVGLNSTISSQQNNHCSYKKQALPYNTNFKGLLPKSTVDKLRMCVFDLDETLLEGAQATRDKILEFSKSEVQNGTKRILVYSSSRALKNVQPLIDNKTLTMPDYYIGNNGLNIYKNLDGKLQEIQTWSKGVAKGFSKEKIREFMVELAHQNMFSKKEWAKIPKEIIPEGQKEFRGSKITEYEVFGSPLNIYFMMTPGMFEKNLPQIKNFLTKSGIEAEVKFQNFDKDNLNSLGKIFQPEIAKDMKNHAIPRLKPDGSVDVAIITAVSDKGKATEYLRETLGLKPNEIFAAGDDINDSSNANKGYFFAVVSNATDALKKTLSGRMDDSKIIRASKAGVDGIWEAIG